MNFAPAGGTGGSPRSGKLGLVKPSPISTDPFAAAVHVISM